MGAGWFTACQPQLQAKGFSTPPSCRPQAKPGSDWLDWLGWTDPWQVKFRVLRSLSIEAGDAGHPSAVSFLCTIEVAHLPMYLPMYLPRYLGGR